MLLAFGIVSMLHIRRYIKLQQPDVERTISKLEKLMFRYVRRDSARLGLEIVIVQFFCPVFILVDICKIRKILILHNFMFQSDFLKIDEFVEVFH